MSKPRAIDGRAKSKVKRGKLLVVKRIQPFDKASGRDVLIAYKNVNTIQ